MQIPKILIASLFAFIAAAAPTAEAEAFALGEDLSAPTLVERDPPTLVSRQSVTYGPAYEDINYGGAWAWIAGAPNVCNNIGASWSNRISSAKIAWPYRCVFYDPAGCGGTGYTVGPANPTASAPAYPSWIDNKASSYKCW